MRKTLYEETLKYLDEVILKLTNEYTIDKINYPSLVDMNEKTEIKIAVHVFMKNLVTAHVSVMNRFTCEDTTKPT